VVRIAVLGLLVAVLVPASAAAGTPAPVVGAAASGSLWTAPLGGSLQVVRAFAAPADRYGPGHRGVDLAGIPGEPVLSAGDGIVVFAGMVAGRPVVSVQHDGGLRTTYEPVTPTVGAGEAVARGSPIGILLAGHPGCAVAACLHWGLRRGEGYLDPLLLLRPPRLRLLPWT
jgi:murein DD-endopeptidase MepM/ murein hydrolase activator NlpD